MDKRERRGNIESAKVLGNLFEYLALMFFCFLFLSSFSYCFLFGFFVFSYFSFLSLVIFGLHAAVQIAVHIAVHLRKFQWNSKIVLKWTPSRNPLVIR